MLYLKGLIIDFSKFCHMLLHKNGLQILIFLHFYQRIRSEIKDIPAHLGSGPQMRAFLTVFAYSTIFRDR